MIALLLFAILCVMLLELCAAIVMLTVKALIGITYVIAWGLAAAGALVGWVLTADWGRSRDVW